MLDKLILFWLTTLFINCTSSQSRISIEPLTMLNYIASVEDRGKMVVNKVNYYLIHGYEDTKKVKRYIDRFVNNNKDSNLEHYAYFSMIFYKASFETNTRNILSNPRVIDRYSQNHDLIYKYWWSNGRPRSTFKYKNGEVIDPKIDIEVSDVPEE